MNSKTVIPVVLLLMANTLFAEITSFSLTNYQRAPLPSPQAEVSSRTNSVGENAISSAGRQQKIMLVPGGARADFGLQKVFFPADVNGENTITVTSPDGAQLAFRPRLLAWHDVSTGERWLLAQVTNQVGLVIGTSRVLYTNAFDGIHADMRYRYTRHGLEQDVILRVAPGLPTNASPENLKLEVWTEWFNANPTAQLVQSIDLREGSDATNTAVIGDESLTFGTMRIGAGHAFSINNSADKTPVAKEWAEVEGRNWLIEMVDYLAIKSKCDELASSSNRTARLVTGKKGLIAAASAPLKVGKSRSEALLASVDLPETPGLVLDFAILSCVPVPAGAVSWWPAGGNAEDALDGNDGSLGNLATFAPGKVGQGFSFPLRDYEMGTGGGFVRIPDNTNLHFTNALTIEGWVNPGEYIESIYYQMVDKWEATGIPLNNKSYSTGLDPEGHFFLLLSPSGTDEGAAFVLSSNTVPVGEWTHVAGTYDGSVLKVYVNGVLQGEGECSEIIFAGTNDMGIGGVIGGGTEGELVSPFFGRIDEPATYNRALSASEIQTIYGAGVAGKINPNCLEAPANLVAWWPGDGHAFDIAGTNNATLQNGATYAPGVTSQGFSFDGDDDSLLTTNASVLNFNTNDNFSIELWLQPKDIVTSNGVMTLLSKRLVSNTNTVVGWELFLMDGAPALQLADAPLRTTNWVNYVLTGTNLCDGGWHHLVVTVDRSTNNGGSFYLEGAKVATFNPTLMPGALTNSEPLRMGLHPQGALHCNYAGMMDEISIYRRALTGTEVSQLYQAGGAGKCRADVDHDGLEDWWEMRFFENLDQGPNDNPDSDVFNNLEEFQNHTDPTVFDKRALIVTAGEDGYNPNEQAMKDRLEGLGYVVTQKRDSIVVASDTKYQTVVVVSPNVYPGNLNTKLNKVATPILCMGNYMLRDLKLTGSNSGTDYDGQSGQTATTIIEPSQSLAGGFSGSVTVASSGTDFVWGNPNTNAIRVARLGGGTTNQATIFAFEKGKLMNQLVASARRVGFFSRDTTNLNSNGWQLFDAAVNWLAAINVTGALNTPASITITSPANAATFNAGDNITLKADVVDPDTGVQKVVFYRDNTRLGSVTMPVTGDTYSMVWNNAPAGTYQIKVRAIDYGDTGTLSEQLVFITVRSSALLVTGSTNLNSSEGAISNRLHQLGFTVTTKAAENTGTADARGKTLILLSSTVPVVDGTNKFAGLDVPVVTWADQLYPDLGFVDGGDHGTVSGRTQLCVLTPSHPLSGGLSGTNMVLLSPESFSWGTPGINAVKVAIVNGETNKTVIFGYDRGASMFGRVALARKVGFFLSESNAVSLTASGWNLFDAAVAWAIDKPCPTAVDLVMAMDRSGGMNGQPEDDAKTAAKLLVNSLELGTDKAGLVSFHNIPSLDQALTTNGTAVATAINALVPLGPDRIDFGITNAQAELTGVRHNPSALPVMILMTHGRNDPSDTSTSINIAADAAKAAGIRLVVVGFGDVDQERLSAIASSSADFYNAPLSSELADISASIGDAFCRSANLSPSVTITNPASGQSFVGPTADVTIQATATDPDGTISNVEFYHGSTLLTNFTSAPYSFIWSNRNVGIYTVFARATDNNGATALSSVTFGVGGTPVINIVTPTNGSIVVLSPTNVALLATATNVSGTITGMRFYNGPDLISSTNGSAIRAVFTNAVATNYTLTAWATNNFGLTSFTNVSFFVNAMPVITNNTPTNTQRFSGGVSVSLTNTAWDPDGIVTNVTFYRWANSTSTPIAGTVISNEFKKYSLTWSGLTNGAYAYYAVATDTNGASSASPMGVFKVGPTNDLPTVWITYPTNGQTFCAGGDIDITASVSPASVTNVQFFLNDLSLGNDGFSPYGATAHTLKPGNYSLVALATDGFGSSSISTQVNITVSECPPTGQSYWDPNFYLPLSDECGTHERFAWCADGVLSSAVKGNTFYFSANEYWAVSSLWRLEGTNWHRWETLECDILPLSNEQLAVGNSKLYVAGYEMFGDYSVGIFDGTNWSKLGESFQVEAGDYRLSLEPRMTPRVQLFAGDLYIYGNFSGVYTNGGSGVNTNLQYIARWDAAGSEWVSVGSPLNGPVLAMADIGGHLFIGGLFTHAASNTNANRIAELVNGDWANLGSGIAGTNSSLFYLQDPIGNYAYTNVESGVFSLAAWGNNLIAGGDFTIAGGMTNVGGVALWDGKQWQAIGGGLQADHDTEHDTGRTCDPKGYLNPIVHAIVVRDKDIYVGGSFSSALDNRRGIVPAVNIAKASWDEGSKEWTWTDLDYGLNSSCVNSPFPRGLVSTLSIMDGPTPCSYDVIAGGEFNRAGEYLFGLDDSSSHCLLPLFDNRYRNIARWRVGFPPPEGPPLIGLTIPVNDAVVTNPPTYLQLQGWAQSTLTNIDKVEVFANGDSIGSLNIDPSTNDCLFSFTASQSLGVGAYRLKAIAADSENRIGESKPVVITIRSTDLFAHDDSFSIPEGSKTVSLPVLVNDTSGVRISQVTQFDQNLGRAVRSYDGTNISYTLRPGRIGTDHFWYAVTNSANASDFAWVTVKIKAAPRVDITTPSDRDRFLTNTPITFRAFASDYDYDREITNITLRVNGDTIWQTNTTTLDYVWHTNVAGFYLFDAVVTDDEGTTNRSSPVTIMVNNTSTNANPPIAIISNLTNALMDQIDFKVRIPAQISQGLFELQGTAKDDDDAGSYKVLLYRPEDWENTGELSELVLSGLTPYVDLTRKDARNYQGFCTNEVTNGSLGTLDLTTIPNGIYDLVLLVRGGSDETLAIVRIQLDSQLKIGQFSFSEQDLSIPVNGIPLTIVRTYNSMNPRAGDFGTSWTYALNSMDIQLDEERKKVVIGGDDAPFADDEEDDSGLPKVVSLRTGGSHDVTLTLPDGRRTTFLFTPDMPSFDPWVEASFNGYAKWTGPADVQAKLTLPPSSSDVIRFFGGEHHAAFWADGGSLSTFEMHDVPGWVLETQDGTKYEITRGERNAILYYDDAAAKYRDVITYDAQPKLTKIRQRSGDVIKISDTGVEHYDPQEKLTRSILIERDLAGRIVALRDPNSGSDGLPVVKYVYNRDTDNLIQVHRLQDRAAGTYTIIKYHYDNPSFPHYITSIEDPRGIPLARNEFDDSGKLIAVVDANGQRTEIEHHSDTGERFERVIDRKGYASSFVYDARGNVIFQTNALKVVTATTYDPISNLKTAETNALGRVGEETWSMYSYDDKGYQTEVVTLGGTVGERRTNAFAYNSFGSLLWRRDPLGNLSTNKYDGSGNLLESVRLDASSNIVSRSSSIYVNGLLTETRNADDLVTTSFSYDSKGNLKSTEDANGQTRNFEYDASGNQITNGYLWTNGSTNRYVFNRMEYDGQGRVVRTVDSQTNSTLTVYNSLGKVDHSVDRLGNTNRFLHDARGNLIQSMDPYGLKTRTVYDGNGRDVVTTDRDNITGTRTEYDPAGRVTNTVRLAYVSIGILPSADGVSSYSVVTSNGIPLSTNSTEYLPNGWVKSRTTPDGKTEYEYYPDGQLMRVTDAMTNRTFYAYDEAGRQKFVVDALNRTNHFEYDAVGRMIKTIFADNTFTTNRFNNLGQRVGVQDQAGLLTEFGYNLSGQLTSVTKPGVIDPEDSYNTNNPVWSYEYDQYGKLTVTTDPRMNKTTNSFDELGRQTARFLTSMSSTKPESNYYNGKGQLALHYDFKEQRTEYRYDQYGRVTRKYYFAAHDPHPSNSVQYVYNELGKLRSITELTGTNAEAGYVMLGRDNDKLMAKASGYEKARAAVAGLLGKVSTQTWGGMGALVLCGVAWATVPRVKRRRFVWCVVETWRYYNNVELQSKRRIRLPSYGWRVASIVTLICVVGSDPKFSSLWTARAACGDVATNTSTPTMRVTEYSYDLEGRLAQVNSPEGYINYEYSLTTGRLTNTCTTNSAVSYDYDSLGRLWHVSVSKRNRTNLISPEITTYAYNEVGSRASVTLPNGTLTQYHYDELNRLTNLTHKAHGTNLLASYSYQLHPTGRRTHAVEVLLNVDDSHYETNTHSWGYDGLYRLTNEVTASTSSGLAHSNTFEYDKVGNRLKQTRELETITYQYNDNDQLTTETSSVSGPTAYGYDGNGSLITKSNANGTITYAYDLKNKLSSVTTGGTTTKFVYNEQGIRVKSSVVGGSTKYFLVDVNNHTGYAQVLEELDALGDKPAMSYVIGDDVLGQSTVSTVSWLLYDGHGSTRHLLKGEADITAQYNYEAYGQSLTTLPSNPEASTSMLYCGEQYDSALSMYNLRARFYDPSNGRFTAMDSFTGNNEDPQSLHRYLYGQGDPVNSSDPSGHFVLLFLTAFAVIGLVFVLDTPKKPTIRPLTQGEQGQISLVTAVLRSYDMIHRAVRLASVLQNRDYRVDAEMTYDPKESNTMGYTFPPTEPNRIYLPTYAFNGSSAFFSRDFTIDCSTGLMDIILHENLHLELGRLDPDGSYVDEVALLSPMGPYLESLHKQMLAEQKKYRSEHP